MIVSPGAAKSRMRRGAALLLLAACALAVAWVAAGGTDRAGAVVTRFWRINYTVFPVKDRAALAAIHADPSRVARERCAACHEGKKGSNLVLHRIHLRSDLLANLECPDCHQHIDLETRSNRAVVTWVDVGFCRQCHSAFPGLDPGSPMKPEYFEALQPQPGGLRRGWRGRRVRQLRAGLQPRASRPRPRQRGRRLRPQRRVDLPLVHGLQDIEWQQECGPRPGTCTRAIWTC